MPGAPLRALCSLFVPIIYRCVAQTALTPPCCVWWVAPTVSPAQAVCVFVNDDVSEKVVDALADQVGHAAAFSHTSIGLAAHLWPLPQRVESACHIRRVLSPDSVSQSV